MAKDGSGCRFKQTAGKTHRNTAAAIHDHMFARRSEASAGSKEEFVATVYIGMRCC
jgi:hypothetical protein